VTKQLPDRKLRLFSLRPGTVFGEMALLAGQPRSANVHATTDVVCLSLSHDAFEKLCAQRPEIGIRMLLNISREMSRRLATMGKTLQELEK
jgi:CRP-like cAMP-binding protein